MLALQILLMIFLVWILIGCFRPLLPKNGRWYDISIFRKIRWIVNGSKAPPFIPLPPGINHTKRELTWTEYQKKGVLYDSPTKSYMNVEYPIGTKTEETDIRHLEEHPIVVDVVLSDGFKATLIFDVTLKVFDPWLLIPRKGFLTYVQQEFSDVVSPWAHTEKNITNILAVHIEEVKKEITFEIGGKTVDLWEYLDEKKFKQFGFCIFELSLKGAIPPESQKVFKIQQEKEEEKVTAEKLVETEKRREQERIIFTKDADTERDVQKKDLAVTGEYQKGILETIFKGKRSIARAYQADTLVINESQKDEEKIEKLTSSVTGNLITHKRLASLVQKDLTQKPDKKEDKNEEKGKS